MPSSHRVTVALLAAALALAAAGLYAPVLDHPFLAWDDDLYIRDNPWVHGGLTRESLEWAFRTHFGANWFPLTWISWFLDQEIHGLTARGVHATNVVLHATSSGLLFVALARLTGALAPSAFVAAVFAFHPIQVESVAWAAERKGLLAMVFWMGALALWSGIPHGAARAGWRRVAGASLLLAFGLMAKALPVTFPFVLLLLDLWPLQRLGDPRTGALFRRDRIVGCLVEKLPLFGVALAGSIVGFAAQRGWGAMMPLAMLPLGQRLANAVYSYAMYVWHFVWPVRLGPYYPHPQLGLSSGEAVASVAFLFAVTALALWQIRRRPYVVVGWLWFLGTFLPMIGLVQLGSQGMADRYAYLPSVGLAIALTWLVVDAVPRRKAAQRALGAAACVLLVALAFTTRTQIGHWSDGVRLFARAVEVTRGNYIAEAKLGEALHDAGRSEEAIAHYRAALRIFPGFRLALRDLAWILATHPDAELRRPKVSLQLAQRLVQRSPNDASALDTLAAAQAANGLYAVAARTVAQGLRRVHPDDPALAAGMRQRLLLYRAKSPYREPARDPVS